MGVQITVQLAYKPVSLSTNAVTHRGRDVAMRAPVHGTQYTVSPAYLGGTLLHKGLSFVLGGGCLHT